MPALINVCSHPHTCAAPTFLCAGAGLFDVNEVRGGSAYGAGTLAGADGSRQPSKLELDYAQHQVRF